MEQIVGPVQIVVNTAIPALEDKGVLERIQGIVQRRHFHVRNITTHLTDCGMWIDVDMEVPPEMSLGNAHAMASDLEDRLWAEFRLHRLPEGDKGDTFRVPNVRVHVKPGAEELVISTELPPHETARYRDCIQALCCETPGAYAYHDVCAQRLGRHDYLAFDLELDPQLSVSEVVRICEEMETRLQREFPQLGRVMIHAEPVADYGVAC